MTRISKSPASKSRAGARTARPGAERSAGAKAGGKIGAPTKAKHFFAARPKKARIAEEKGFDPDYAAALVREAMAAEKPVNKKDPDYVLITDDDE